MQSAIGSRKILKRISCSSVISLRNSVASSDGEA